MITMLQPLAVPESSPKLSKLIDAIVESYREDDVINHLGHCPLPRYDAVVDILLNVKDILFPGYRRQSGLNVDNIAYHVGSTMDRVAGELGRQISLALQHEARVNGNEIDCLKEFEYREKGAELALQFLACLPGLRRVLATDVRAAYDGDPAAKTTDEIVFCYPGLAAITVYRIAHRLQKLNVPFIPRMMTEWAHKETGIDIHPGANIGNHFFIDHGTGVVVGGTCVIGDHVKLYQGVTLGALSFPTTDGGDLIRDTKRHPTIEDHVVVYANATILGGRTVIGHHCVVGASTWVVKSVPPETTILLEAPKLKIRGKGSNTNLDSLDFQI